MNGLKINKIAIVISLFTCLNVGISYAGAAGKFKDLDVASIFFNGREMSFKQDEVPALQVDGTVLVPVEAIAEKANLLAIPDTETGLTKLYKPNVHMIFGLGESKDGKGIRDLFGKVKKGVPIDFSVFVQVDNLIPAVRSVKLDMVDSAGNTIVSSKEYVLPGKEDFWYTWGLNNVVLNYTGKYTVRFLGKLDADNTYHVLSEKNLVCE